MKFEYKSPVVTVEELTKVDVLCDSAQNGPDPTKTHYENTHFDFADIM